MESASLEGWHDFFVMTGGAAAALAGLIIVAMSVNIKEILAGRSLTARAAAAIAGLMLIVVIAALGLAPGQPDGWLGAEVMLGALVLAVFVGVAVRRVLQPSPYAGTVSVRAVKAVLLIVPVIPFLVGALLLLVGGATGMAWICAAVVAVFVTSMLNAWVLLVEVLR